MSEQMKVCPICEAPVIFTFEFPQAEFYCQACGWKGGVLDPARAVATDERRARLEELSYEYACAQAERQGRRKPERPVAPEGPAPACRSCGVVATPPLDASGKPAHWYVRSHGNEDWFACSLECAQQLGGMVAPW